MEPNGEPLLQLDLTFGSQLGRHATQLEVSMSQEMGPNWSAWWIVEYIK